MRMFIHRINEKTYLRKLETRDAPALFKLVDSSREELRRWLPWLDDNKSVKDSEAFIRSSLAQETSNNGFQAGIWHDGQLAGVIGLHGINWRDRQTMIGYWLGSEYQGKGIVTEACEALLKYAFEILGLNRVVIRAAEGNDKSIAVAKRLGFSREGLLRENEWLYDHYQDMFVYAMLAKDFKESQGNRKSSDR